MAFCESVLRKHGECLKSFLRDARMHNTPYEPGSYGEHDRCQYTREAYVECRMTDTSVNQASRKDRSQGAAGGSDSRMPTPCQMELNMHGQCVENFLKKAMTQGTDYTQYVKKCSDSRELFDKCITAWENIQQGKDPMKLGQGKTSKAGAGNFAVAGKWQ